MSTEHSELFARTWRIAATGYPSHATLDDLVEQLLPQIEALDGYLGGNILVDRDHGDILATTFWDSMETLTAAQARATNAAAGTLVISDRAGIRISVCDVLVSTPVPCLVNRELGGRPARASATSTATRPGTRGGARDHAPAVRRRDGAHPRPR